MTRYRIKDGKRIKFSAEEETARDAEEKAWNDAKPERDLLSLRKERNALLKETDHYALSDVTMTDEMRTYRQSLRDITDTYQSMEDEGFAFPEKPTE